MKRNINVVIGGPSAEHEISIKTGFEILKNLDHEKYRPMAVVITADKRFYRTETLPPELTLDMLNRPSASAVFKGPFSPDSSGEVWRGCACAVLALHGEFGEDGKFQGFLETLGIPYTGSGVFASAVGMEKIASKHLFQQNGITTPLHVVYKTKSASPGIQDIVKKLGLPCFVKCPQSGSSRLLGKAETMESLQSMIAEFSDHSDTILVESMVAGEEYTCPVLEYPDGSVKALPPILIRPMVSAFFDFTAKYSDGGSEEIVPAPCSAELTKRLQETALAVHAMLKCAGVSRTDMIVRDSVIHVLETNTLPGMTSASLVPKAFKAAGGTFPELLDILIETAISRSSR